ncbi:MAG: carbohydrate kinase [Chitinophagaceae bacterium]|nr:MAG: carbohydrate kinase [Chitinophagaceae bacterium]
MHQHPVICFGEVLWDVLPAGAEPGGAPMNVTYHLHKHGLQTALITSIGNDEAGQKIKSLFADRGICTDYFFTDAQQQTGIVYAHANANNDMTYDIVKPVAWDFIPYTEQLAGLVSNASYFVYGSLAARSEVSRYSLLALLNAARTKVLDINLRAPHYNEQALLPLLQQADILKMNEEELELVGGWFAGNQERKDLVRSLSEALNIATIIVTLGAKGALLFMNDQFYEHSGYKVQVADTIGSGDSFLAGFLSQLIKGTSPEDALDYASRLGALIATKKGGCPEYSIEEIKSVH